MTPPPVPVTVMVWAPSATLLPMVTVIVDVPAPGAGMGLGLYLAKVPPPDKVIAEWKPPAILVVIVEVPELPRATVMALGFALMTNLPVAVTFSVTVVVCVMLPLTPVTVIV